jgi:thymidylate synthase (FAD)
MSNRDEVERLRWHKFPVLDQGFVCLVDVMGDDEAICEAARVSYSKGTKRTSGDRDLIRYLMRHRHTSPFEMAELKFAFRMPQMVWWQMVRHRTASCNVESGRYSEMSEDMMRTPPDGWRSQATGNKQGSGGLVDSFPSGFETVDSCGDEVLTDGGLTAGEFLSEQERRFQAEARALYDQRIKFGVAREQARKDLSMSVYIHVVWKIDLHNLFHFLGLRMDLHAQLEIRQYATTIGEQIVAPLFPLAWEAFRDYQFGALTLSRREVEAIRWALDNARVVGEGAGMSPDLGAFDYDVTNLARPLGRREAEEFRDKLRRLGLITES